MLVWDRVRIHHAAQNNAQFKTYELFIPGILCVMFLDCDWLQVTQTTESKIQD
jgi:hypothetical protein